MRRNIPQDDIQARIDCIGLDGWADEEGSKRDVALTAAAPALREFLAARRRLARELSKLGVDVAG